MGDLGSQMMFFSKFLVLVEFLDQSKRKWSASDCCDAEKVAMESQSREMDLDAPLS
jgi:hypothetical protein